MDENTELALYKGPYDKITTDSPSNNAMYQLMQTSLVERSRGSVMVKRGNALVHGQ